MRVLENEIGVYEQGEPNDVASCSMDKRRVVCQLPVGADTDLQNGGEGGGEKRGERQSES